MSENDPPVQWGDFDNLTESEGEEETPGIEEIEGGSLQLPKSELDSECCCFTPVATTDICSILSKEKAINLTPANSQCHIGNIERCINFVISGEGGSETTWERLLVADMFFRYRHELLAVGSLRALNLAPEVTDTPFSNFGVDSNRTPDYIIERAGVYHIFEFTATANEDRAAQMKGVASAGFESKYLKEIKEMQSAGAKVEYSVIMFDMLDVDNSSAWDTIKFLGKEFVIDEQQVMVLKSISRELSRLTKLTRSMFALSAGLLFSPVFQVEKRHDNLKFCYEEKDYQCEYIYKDFNVSMPVYQKISQMWHRLYPLKERQTDSTTKIMPILEITENRLKFINDNRGVNDGFLNNLLQNNDKQGFLEVLWLKVGNKISRATESETGVKFTRKIDKTHQSLTIELIPVSLDHNARPVDCGLNMRSMIKYSKIMEAQKNQLYCPVYQNDDYESTLLDSMTKFDIDCSHDRDPETFKIHKDAPPTIASHSTENIDVDALMDKMMGLLEDVNKFECSIPVRNRKMKSSFLLPFSSLSNKDRCPLSEKPVKLLETLVNENIGDYTKAVILQTLKEDYKFYDTSPPPSAKLNDLYSERYGLSNNITRLVKDCMKKAEGIGRIRFKKDDLDSESRGLYDSATTSVSSVNKLIRKMEKEEGIKRNIGMVRIKTNSKTVLGQAFRAEMSHFKDKSKQSAYEGVGLLENINIMDTRLSDEYDMIMESLVMNNGENDDFLIDMNTYEDVKILKNLKAHTLESYKAIINQAKNSMLGHAAAFVSRYAHSLTFYSQLPFNNSYIRVDTLGYKNVLLIVRGGSKIFKTKNSKLHRLLFPVAKPFIGQYSDQSYGHCSYKHITIGGQDYILTPWILLNESILLDAISFYPRVMSFCVLNMDNERTFKSQLHKVYLNVLLAFHNRRQTESMLANLRYILLSTMGDYSAFEGIFSEFIGFNYDKLQAYIRIKLIRNYPNYFKIMRKIQKMKSFNSAELERLDFNNIFTMYPIHSTDDIALMIYSTFLMTKAPYQKSVERAANLKGILEIHKLYDEQVGLGLNPEEQLKSVSVVNHGDYLDYSQRLIKSDFALDPYYCSNVGVFADSYFLQHVGSDDILLEWIKILNKNWDSMATTTGLRGMDQKNFFGQKGFFVIYDHIINKMDYKNKLKFILNGDLTEDAKRKELRALNLTFGSEIDNVPDCLVFHAVDKRQWRGSREIYVMDMATKRMQQPIEKFMAYLCKKTDTELISIPSDKRSQVIHHALFEKDLPDKDFQQWFLTLDCSKWAPKSMFIKFALMIIPMTSIPGSFKTHFMNYLSLLYTKKLYFNKQEVAVLKNNPQFMTDDGYLISDEAIDGFHLIQPYSWVMGIFNYTSSLMHAFNQKYCSYLLRESTLATFHDECSLFMFAHSDDSGGRIAVNSKPALERALFYYEVNLKACNHILSRKKCVISKIYFEILSIIYMFSQLLALLPKFLGGIRFLPTDKGPSHDMLQTYSKGIEVMVAGADFNKAYLYQKFYSAEIWRFYYNCLPNKNDYLRPPQYLGMPDAHPLMVLLNGSDSDIIRIIASGNIQHIIMIYRLFKYLDVFQGDEGLIKSLKFIVKIRGVRKGFEESIESYKEILNLWSLSNVNYKNTGMDSLSFLKKLSDPGFTGALVNETEARRMSRAYFFRSGESINTKIGIKGLKEAYQLISEVHLLFTRSEDTLFKRFFGEEAVSSFNEEVDMNSDLNKPLITYFNDIYSNSLKLCDYFNRMEFTPDKLKRTVRTLKPTHIQIVKFGRGIGGDFDPTQLISSIFEPQMSWALPNPSNLEHAKQDFYALLDHLKLDKEQMDASTALKLVRTHQNKSVKEIYMYSCIPGYLRMIKNFAGIITFLSTNSYHNYEIQGMSLKLRDNLTSPPIGVMDIDEQAYYINTLLDVVCTLSNRMDLKDVVFNPLSTIGYKGGCIRTLIETLQERRFSDDNYSFYSHYLEYLNNKYILWFANNTGEIFSSGAYYTYIKEQKFRGVWYGAGTLGLYYNNDWLVLEIYNNKVTSSQGSIVNKVDRRFASFINDTLFSNNIDPGFNDPITRSYASRSSLYLGFDLSGDVAVDNHLNMRSGIAYTIKGYEHTFLQDIKSAEVYQAKSNLFIAKTLGNKSYKIYTLKVERAEVIPILKQLVDPQSLQEYLINNGYDSYLEFISQSVLSSYGAEYYITLKDLTEGYSGSSLYKLFTETQRLDQSHLPVKLETAKLPAPKGSLLRMILNYQESECLEIIRQPKELNPSIMSVRNEFPESFSVVLAEQMEKNFDKIYDDSDQLQMMDEFVKAANCDDTDKVRSSCIKLMCYWGYSGLVNVLKTYTFNKSEKNYSIFSIDNTTLANKVVFLDLFKQLFWAIRSSLMECYDNNKNLEWVLPEQKPAELVRLCDQYVIDTVYSSYNFKMYSHHPPLSLVQFNNLILTMIKDSTFVKKLNDKLKDTHPLNTLDISPKSGKNLIATLNTLRGVWMKQKGETQNVSFEYHRSYQHLPHSVTNPMSLINELKPIKVKSGRSKYHFFLNDALRHELEREEVYMHVKGQRCIIKQEVLKSLDNSDVPTNKVFAFENVLTEEYLESDDCSDIIYELDSTEPDKELIDSAYSEEFDGEKYETTTIKKRGNSLVIPVKWIYLPYVETTLNLVKKFNNAAENLVVLSNNFINKFSELRCSRIYHINRSPTGDLPDMIAHVMSVKSLPGAFWDKYIGGRRIPSADYLIKLTYSNSIRWVDEVREFNALGEVVGAKETKREVIEITEDDAELSPWLKLGLDRGAAQNCYNKKREREQLKSDIASSLNEYLESGLINEETAKKLSVKYNKALSTKLNLGGNSILESFLTETELLTINQGIVSGKIGEEITATDQIKIMQAPESFGTAYLHSRPDNKAFKDIRFKAEIDSLHDGLSTLVASSNLTISTKMFTYVKSHYNIWRQTVANTKYKSDCKKFFLNLYLSIVNTSSQHRTSKHDSIWQNLINRMALIIGEEPEEPDVSLNYYLPPTSGLRLKYRTVGLT